MISVLILIAGLLLLAATIYCFNNSSNSLAHRRLENLLAAAAESSQTAQIDIDWEKGADLLTAIQDRFGKAGFIDDEGRARAKLVFISIIVAAAFIGVYLGLRFGSIVAVCAGTLAGLYGGFMAALFWLRARENDFNRQILFYIPLTLEELILLVESGLGILPAVEQVVSKDQGHKKNPVVQFLHIAYELTAHGLPFSQALEMVSDAADQKVLRHVLLHLDISGSEGGELVPSLRSLSEHTHTTWKISVESRVKRLENLVVFPVFASVIGLMFLTVSVPIVPVLKLSEVLSAQQNTESENNLSQTFTRDGDSQ